MMSVRTRRVTAEDTVALAAVYRDAVMKLGRRKYNEAQLRVWAEFADDLKVFRHMLSAGVSLCIEVDDTPVAFGQLNPDDYVALLYCHSGHVGKGYASAILRELERYAREQGIVRIQVKASFVARPFFEHHGYVVTEEECVTRSGVELSRYSMEKTLPV